MDDIGEDDLRMIVKCESFFDRIVLKFDCIILLRLHIVNSVKFFGFVLCLFLLSLKQNLNSMCLEISGIQ